MTASPAQRTIDAVWRIESPRLIAGLARMVRDVGLAEDMAQDALVIALEKWPEQGIPDNPGAWLMTVAKRRALDQLRRNQTMVRKYEEISREYNTHVEGDLEAEMDNHVGDDMLRLIFTTCHPILSPEARVTLTLRLLGGLTTKEIAHAYLLPEPTTAQRIVRAKHTLAAARVPFELPAKEELSGRLSSVLEVIYLMFNEGYAATSGGKWMRPALCEEALRLGRILAAIAPTESDVHGLVALMEIQASRFRARVNEAGEPILLLDQNRSLWDHLLIRRGLASLKRVEELGSAFGPYALQASIAACHARARTAEETNWAQIAALYDGLAQMMPSPVVELNRAVALSMAFGPAIGLEAIEALMQEPSLQSYHLLPSIRGDFLMKLGRFIEASAEFKRAASLTNNEREHELLQRRVEVCLEKHDDIQRGIKR